jgi:hypothetical protein
MPDAHLIAEGWKGYEIRTRRTHYRGPLLICASRVASTRTVYVPPRLDWRVVPAWKTEDLGHALCVVELYSCEPMTEAHEDSSFVAHRHGAWAWGLRGARKIPPFPVLGRLGFFDVSARPCPNCHGVGAVVDSAQCYVCSGKKVVRDI